MKFCIKMLLSLVVLGALWGLSWAYAVTDLSGPGTLSKSGETYRLIQNITASGTAFTISGSNITLDLNQHTITFSTSSSGYGVYITGSNNIVKNGYITGGGGSQVNVAGVGIRGSSNEVYNLAIHINGGTIGGDQFVNSVNVEGPYHKVHHVYGEVHGSTRNISYAPDNIWYSNRGGGGTSIHDCVLVWGHRGINADLVGYQVSNPPRSLIYNNFVQHMRTPGCKQPNGIGVTMAKNFDVYNNQIISDDGRGFITSSYGNGDPTGTSGVNFYNNRVDVGYMIPAAGGQYPENHVAGLYSRYSSFNCNYHDNIVIVDNAAGTATECAFVGSDSPDLQSNNYYFNNTLINRDSGTDASAFRVAVNGILSITNNAYYAPAGLWIGNWDYYNSGGIKSLINSGNTAITRQTYTPVAPKGLKLTKFFNSYLLTWNDSRVALGESQTYEYHIYRDGLKIPGISSRGGTFYVDADVTGAHTYQISGVNLAGTEGATCAPVSTSAAVIGWGGAVGPSAPKAPINLKAD